MRDTAAAAVPVAHCTPPCCIVPQSQQVNEVEEVIKELKTNPGFSAYVIMNNDGEREVKRVRLAEHQSRVSA